MLIYVLSLLFLVLIIILFFTRIKLVIEYVRKDQDDHITYSIFYIKGFFKHKYEISFVDFINKGLKFVQVREEGKGEKKTGNRKGRLTFGKFGNKFNRYSEIYTYLKKRFIVEEFNLVVDIGTGDACCTGIVSGIIWSLAGVLTALLENDFHVKKRRVNVHPVFVEEKLEIDLYCIFSAKVVHIILMALKYGKFSLFPKTKNS